MGEIHKLTKDGITLFPATTTDAVVHPQVRAAVSNLITEYNVSSLFPTAGSEGSSKYTLQGAISLLFDKLKETQRFPGIKVIFTDFTEPDVTQEWRYLGGSFTTTTNWAREDSWYTNLSQDVSDIEENILNDALRKSEQSLTTVEKNQVKNNLDLSLDGYKVTWSSTEDANNYTTPGIYTITGYRVNPGDNLPTKSYGASTQIAGTLIVNKAQSLETVGQTFISCDSTLGITKIYCRSYNELWSDWREQLGKAELGKINCNVLNTLVLPGIYTGSITNPGEVLSDMDVVLASSYSGNTKFKLIQTVNDDKDNLRCSQIIYLLTNLDTDLTEDNRTKETLMIRTGKRNNTEEFFTFSEFTTFVTKAHLDSILGTEINTQLSEINESISTLQETVSELVLKNSSDYCVSAWDNDSLAPTCIETYGSLDFCDQWDFYLIDTTDNTGDTTEPVGKLMRNNLFRFEDGSWAPVVGIKEERRAECDVALYTSPDNGTTLNAYCEAGMFDAAEFYQNYGMDTKLYNIDGVEVNILRPWETTETKYTICLGRKDTIYLLDNVLGNSGKRWKGIFAKPITWDGIDVSKYELKPTGISPGPACVIKDGELDKLRNFFYLYEGESCCAGYRGYADCEIFRYNRTWPVSYDYTSSNGYRISQTNNMKWARNNNSNTESPVPFAEGGFFALNSYLTSYEVFYGTKYLHSQSMFTEGIYSSTPSNETSWKTVGNIRYKEAVVNGTEQDLDSQNWSYKAWGSYIQTAGYYYKSDATDTNTTWSSAINYQLPKEQCMESQIVASFAAETGIEENTEFEFYGNTYWYKNVPGTVGLGEGKMNVVIYKLVKGTAGVYKYDTDGTTIIPVTLNLEIILPIGLVNGANLGGDVFMYWGGGYEQVGTKDHSESSGGSGNFPTKIYLEPNQNNWLYELTYQKSDYGKFEFEDKYPLLAEKMNLSGEGYCKERLPYSGFAITKGGSNSTGECAYHWSGNNWDYAEGNIGRRTRIGARFRYNALYGSLGFRASHCHSTAAASAPNSSASAQISLRIPLQA